MVAFSKSFNPRYFNNVIAIIACLLLNLRHIYSQKIGTYPWGNHVTAEDRMQEILEELHAAPYLETYEDLLVSSVVGDYVDNDIYKLLVKGHHYTNSRYKVKIESQDRLVATMEQKRQDQVARTNEMNNKLLGTPLPDEVSDEVVGVPIVNKDEDWSDSDSEFDEEWDLSQLTHEQVSNSMEGMCIVFPSGWWNYEWCHKQEVRQFHLQGHEDVGFSKHAVGQMLKRDPLFSLGKYARSRTIKKKKQDKKYIAEVVDVYTHGQKLDELENGYRSTEVHIRCCYDGVGVSNRIGEKNTDQGKTIPTVSKLTTYQQRMERNNKIRRLNRQKAKNLNLLLRYKLFLKLPVTREEVKLANEMSNFYFDFNVNMNNKLEAVNPMDALDVSVEDLVVRDGYISDNMDMVRNLYMNDMYLEETIHLDSVFEPPPANVAKSKSVARFDNIELEDDKDMDMLLDVNLMDGDLTEEQSKNIRNKLKSSPRNAKSLPTSTPMVPIRDVIKKVEIPGHLRFKREYFVEESFSVVELELDESVLQQSALSGHVNAEDNDRHGKEFPLHSYEHAQSRDVYGRRVYTGFVESEGKYVKIKQGELGDGDALVLETKMVTGITTKTHMLNKKTASRSANRTPFHQMEVNAKETEVTPVVERPDVRFNGVSEPVTGEYVIDICNPMLCADYKSLQKKETLKKRTMVENAPKSQSKKTAVKPRVANAYSKQQLEEARVNRMANKHGATTSKAPNAKTTSSSESSLPSGRDAMKELILKEQKNRDSVYAHSLVKIMEKIMSSSSAPAVSNDPKTGNPRDISSASSTGPSASVANQQEASCIVGGGEGLEGWWTYEVCLSSQHGIRQYHFNKFMMVDPITKLQSEKKDIVVEFSLGFPDMEVLASEDLLRKSIVSRNGSDSNAGASFRNQLVMANNPYLKLLPTSPTALAANVQKAQAEAANPTVSAVSGSNMNINEASQPSLRLQFEGGSPCDTTEPEPEPEKPIMKKLTPAEKAAAVKAIEDAYRKAGIDVKNAKTMIDDVLADRVQVAVSDTGETVIESDLNPTVDEAGETEKQVPNLDVDAQASVSVDGGVENLHLPKRSSTLDIYCGEKDMILSVLEDYTCHYLIKVSSTMICKHEDFTPVERKVMKLSLLIDE